MPCSALPKEFVKRPALRAARRFIRQSINESTTPPLIPSSKKILRMHELGYELGASAAEQWPSLMYLKEYKGMSYLEYCNFAVGNCLKVLGHSAFNDEFESGFMLGFEKNTHLPIYVPDAEGDGKDGESS